MSLNIDVHQWGSGPTMKCAGVGRVDVKQLK